MRLMAKSAEFERFLPAAALFWHNNILPPPPLHSGEPWIIVEALHQDIRVSLRNLAVAGALRRITPARLLVLTGTDEDWFTALWTGFDVTVVDRLARAYGADDVLDIHRAIDERLAPPGAEPPELVVAGRRLVEVPSGIDRGDLTTMVDATACRVLRVPRLSAAHRAGQAYARVRQRSDRLTDLYHTLFTELNPAALVTSHVDYNHWGLAVETARRFGVPVIHTQSTGSLKAYAMFPEKARGAPTFRAELTQQIGEYFEKYVVANRDMIRRSAELVAWRAKGNLGRPSWWRGGANTTLELLTAGERRAVRAHALDRFGFDRDKPVVAVFNHAVSDALGTNVELFDDLADWFSETVEYAAGRTDANWLLLDHPSQHLYDVTGFFGGIAKRHAGRTHLVFRPSRALSKNVLCSLVDLGVTARGSISNELPAYGIPTIQAGWSEWSACGLSQVATDRDDYWSLVDSAIRGLTTGVPQITSEQVERARLWHWLYRAGADVNSALVQHWDTGQSNQLLQQLRISMSQVESDGDPLFAATRRLWDRREPFLTRFDLSLRDELADNLWGSGQPMGLEP